MLRLMLDSHPEIALNLESEYLTKYISDSGIFPDVTTYGRMLAGDRVFRHSGFTVDEGLDFPALVRSFLRQKLERDKKNIVGATVHLGFGKLRYVWPNAKYVYLIRDGRDVANSVVQMGWAGNLCVAADWWLNAEREWTALRDRLDEHQWIEVRYEELTARPEAQLRRICDFIGVRYSERMFDYVERSTYSWPDAKQNFKWRRSMGARSLRLLEARIGPALAARGYELSGLPGAKIGPVLGRWIQLHSKISALRNRVSKYGLWLVTAEVLTRRLGWSKTHSFIRGAVDEITDKNLK